MNNLEKKLELSQLSNGPEKNEEIQKYIINQQQKSWGNNKINKNNLIKNLNSKVIKPKLNLLKKLYKPSISKIIMTKFKNEIKNLNNEGVKEYKKKLKSELKEIKENSNAVQKNNRIFNIQKKISYLNMVDFKKGAKTLNSKTRNKYIKDYEYFLGLMKMENSTNKNLKINKYLNKFVKNTIDIEKKKEKHKNFNIKEYKKTLRTRFNQKNIERRLEYLKTLDEVSKYTTPYYESPIENFSSFNSLEKRKIQFQKNLEEFERNQQNKTTKKTKPYINSLYTKIQFLKDEMQRIQSLETLHKNFQKNVQNMPIDELREEYRKITKGAENNKKYLKIRPRTKMDYQYLKNYLKIEEPKTLVYERSKKKKGKKKGKKGKKMINKTTNVKINPAIINKKNMSSIVSNATSGITPGITPGITRSKSNIGYGITSGVTSGVTPLKPNVNVTSGIKSGINPGITPGNTRSKSNIGYGSTSGSTIGVAPEEVKNFRINNNNFWGSKVVAESTKIPQEYNMNVLIKINNKKKNTSKNKKNNNKTSEKNSNNKPLITNELESMAGENINAPENEKKSEPKPYVNNTTNFWTASRNNGRAINFPNKEFSKFNE
jgi:hypothetical protein